MRDFLFACLPTLGDGSVLDNKADVRRCVSIRTTNHWTGGSACVQAP
jgi:hypothetical protein